MAAVLGKYDLKFSGLALGEHWFEYDIDDRFFDSFENSEIKKGSVKVDLIMIRNERLLELDIHIYGDAEVVCDRCLDHFLTPVEDRRKLYVKFEHTPSDISEDDDVILISEGDHKMNLAHYFYEFIHLSLPVKRIHPENGSGEKKCNPEMIRKLKEYSTNNQPQNSETHWHGLKEVWSNKNLNN